MRYAFKRRKKEKKTDNNREDSRPICHTGKKTSLTTKQMLFHS